MDEFPSYTYLVGWTEHDKYYYGVRCANKCQPDDDLWTHYFTSSKVVAAFRVEHGEPDVIKVDKMFDDRESASEYELQYLMENNAVYSDKWMNQAAFPHVVQTLDIRNKISKTMSNRTSAHRTITCPQCGQSGGEPGMKRFHFDNCTMNWPSDEVLIEWSETQSKTEMAKRLSVTRFMLRKHLKARGISHPTDRKAPQRKVTCPHCNLTGGITAMNRYHYDNCQAKDWNVDEMTEIMREYSKLAAAEMIGVTTCIIDSYMKSNNILGAASHTTDRKGKTR